MSDAARLVASLDGMTEVKVAIAAGVIVDDATTTAFANADATSRFEFGSIGKTMTAQVLTSLAAEGVVGLDDPIGRWLDAGDNGEITLRQLATHTSGLPRLAPNHFDAAHYRRDDPYAAFTADLAEAGLRASVRGENVYSNFAYQLLGLTLARASGESFEDLLRARVFTPFGMNDATVGPGVNQVQPYAADRPVPPWHVHLAGPGGVSGTLDDLLAWGRGARNAEDPFLGWVVIDDTKLFHNGGTAGTQSSLFADRASGRVAVALIATSDLDHVDDATGLACDGCDPMEARPAPVGDERDADALRFAATMLERRWDDALRLMTDSCSAALTAERLDSAWQEVMVPRGASTGSTVRGAARRNGAIEVVVDLAFTDGAGEARIFFNDAAQVVGLRIG